MRACWVTGHLRAYHSARLRQQRLLPRWRPLPIVLAGALGLLVGSLAQLAAVAHAAPVPAGRTAFGAVAADAAVGTGVAANVAVVRPAGASRQAPHVDWSARRLVASGVGRAPAEVVVLAEAFPLAEQAAKESAVAALRELLCTSGLLPPAVAQALRQAAPTGVAMSAEMAGGPLSGRQAPALAAAQQPASAREDQEMVAAIQVALGRAEAAETTYLADGSVELTAALPLDGGEGGLGEAWLIWQRQRTRSPAQARQSAGGPPLAVAATRARRPRPSDARPPSGIVIEARGVALQPGLWPEVVRSSTGQAVYGAQCLPAEMLRAFGVALFVRSMEAALRDPRVADRAMIVRASAAVPGKSTQVVVNDADADAIAALPALLREGRVVFVTD